LLNYWNEKHRESPFDDCGAWARSGQVIDDLLKSMIDGEDYFCLEAPKSTGTEYFNSDWLTGFLGDDFAPNDVQATLVELTVTTIANALSGLPGLPAKCFVCGGGVHNQYLLERLALKLPQCGVATTSALGLDPDIVEAVAFAWLARERINLRNGNIPQVTRAQRATILGGVYAAD
jgi:anhydro-N-acetylmuramic acid kinase